MRKENINKGVKKEIRLNIKYLDFIKYLVEKKISLEVNNKENIIKEYENSLNLNFSNIKRVDYRSKRKELNNLRENYLKEINLSNSKFLEVSSKLLEINNNRNNNYLKVRI